MRGVMSPPRAASAPGARVEMLCRRSGQAVWARPGVGLQRRNSWALGQRPAWDPAARPPAGGPWDTEVPLFTRSARPSERSRAPSLNARPDLPRAALPAFSRFGGSH